MPDVLSNYAGNAALNLLLHGTTYLAIHLSDPGPTGLLASELAGAGYIRQVMTYSSPSNKTAVSTRAFIFPALPACTALYLAGWTGLAGGDIIWAKLLSPAIVITESGQLRGARGDIAVSL